jgi:hypothetical protein
MGGGLEDGECVRPLVSVDVATVGKCVTRSGISDVSRIRVQEGAGEVKISFVSGRLNRSLNSGGIIRVEDMDILCQRWLDARGHAPNAGAARDMVIALRTAQAHLDIACRLASKCAPTECGGMR